MSGPTWSHRRHGPGDTGSAGRSKREPIMVFEISLFTLIILLVLAALSGAATVFFLAAIVVGARRDEAAGQAALSRKPEAISH